MYLGIGKYHHRFSLLNVLLTISWGMLTALWLFLFVAAFNLTNDDLQRSFCCTHVIDAKTPAVVSLGCSWQEPLAIVGDQEDCIDFFTQRLQLDPYIWYLYRVCNTKAEIVSVRGGNHLSDFWRWQDLTWVFFRQKLASVCHPPSKFER